MRGLVPVSLPLEPKLGSLRSDNYHLVVKTSPLHVLSPILTKCASNLVPRVLYYLLKWVREQPGNEVGTPATEILNNRAINKIIKHATYTSPVMQLICLPLPQVCRSSVFLFSWVLQSSQEKLKTMLAQNFRGANKAYEIWASGVYI